MWLLGGVKMVAPGRDGQIEKAKGSSWGEVGFCVVRGGAETQWALTNSRLCFSNFSIPPPIKLPVFPTTRTRVYQF